MENENNSGHHTKPFSKEDINAIDTYLTVLSYTEIDLPPSDEESIFIAKIKYNDTSSLNLEFKGPIDCEKSNQIIFAHEIADKFLSLYYKMRLHRATGWMNEDVYKNTLLSFRNRLISLICDLKFQGHEYSEPHMHMLIVIKEVFNGIIDQTDDTF